MRLVTAVVVAPVTQPVEVDLVVCLDALVFIDRAVVVVGVVGLLVL